MALRNIKGKTVVDKRQFYSFVLPDGRTAETKANNREEAKRFIEGTLKIQLKEAV